MEQQNNGPNLKSNAAAGYQGPMKIEFLKGAGLLPLHSNQKRNKFPRALGWTCLSHPFRNVRVKSISKY